MLKDSDLTPWFDGNTKLLRSCVAPSRQPLTEAEVCDVPPLGWHCTRPAGHDGPCSAVANDDRELVSRAMKRLAVETAAKKVLDEFGTCSDGLKELYMALEPYATVPPPQRQPWVGLTDEQSRDLFAAFVKKNLGDIAVMDGGRYISHKINNYWLVWQAAHNIKKNT